MAVESTIEARARPPGGGERRRTRYTCAAVQWSLATLGLILLLLAAVSRRLSGTALTPAMVVVALGVLAGPLVLDDITVGPTSETVRTLAEATLAIVLFADASRIDLRALAREASIPLRLLGVGLPLTIALGALAAGALFGSLSLSDALILGVLLAPTDAGLGSAVVTDTRLPQRVRQSLNVESGLNDGICVPLLLIVLASASGPGGSALTEANALLLDAVTFLVFGAVLLGPRGLASIVFAVIVEDSHLAHGATIVDTCYLTVGLSVMLHGVSAAPLVSRYAAWYDAAAARGAPGMEDQAAHAHRARGPARAPARIEAAG